MKIEIIKTLAEFAPSSLSYGLYVTKIVATRTLTEAGQKAIQKFCGSIFKKFRGTEDEQEIKNLLDKKDSLEQFDLEKLSNLLNKLVIGDPEKAERLLIEGNGVIVQIGNIEGNTAEGVIGREGGVAHGFSVPENSKVNMRGNVASDIVAVGPGSMSYGFHVQPVAPEPIIDLTNLKSNGTWNYWLTRLASDENVWEIEEELKNETKKDTPNKIILKDILERLGQYESWETRAKEMARHLLVRQR